MLIKIFYNTKTCYKLIFNKKFMNIYKKNNVEMSIYGISEKQNFSKNAISFW